MGRQGRHCDVVVVGAGMSGLAAAWRLVEAGADVQVLEARDRVGGRAWTVTTPQGFLIDQGGQWIGPTQRHLAALAGDLGVATFPTFTTGESVEIRSGVRHRYSGLVPTSNPADAADCVEAILDLDLAAMEVPTEAPWRAEEADALDALTMGEWLASHLPSPGARAILDVAFKAVFGAEPGEMSVLFTLFYLHAGGGLSNLVRTTGGAQEARFSGGAQQLATGMAVELGQRVRCSSAVTTIAYSGSGVELSISGSSGVSALRAERAVVALPPTVASRIVFDPPLPAERQSLGAGFPMGWVTKIHALYDEPFWRAEGLNGQVVADEGAMRSTFDDSPADGSHGALVGFVAGDECRSYDRWDAARRRAVIVEDLVRAFGRRAGEPVELVEQHWPAEPFTGGGPVAIGAPGALTRGGAALRAPVGPLHWAGTEAATEWCGYLDGALSSGRRAADEVLAVLGGRVEAGRGEH
jgi:monoamine oxidase